MGNKNTDTPTFVNGHNQHLRTSTVASQTLTWRERKTPTKNIAHIPSPKRSNQQKKNRCIRYASFVIIRVSARTSQLSSYRHKRHSGVSKCRSPICLLMRSLLACCILHPSKRKDKDKKKEGKKNRRKEKLETHQLEKKTEVAQMQSSILCGETSHSKLICCSFKRIETKKRSPPLHAIANIEKT